jgi:type VI secretion system protein ImpH
VLPPNTLAYYASLFSMHARPAVGMAQLVADYFRIPAQIDQFVGEWQTIRSGGQFCVGDDGLDGQLGSAVVGNAIFDPMSRVRLRLGPLTRAQFDALKELARFYADDQVGVDAQLVLAQKEIPGAYLSTEGAPRLGFGTWLRSRPPQHDADDVQFRLC